MIIMPNADKFTEIAGGTAQAAIDCTMCSIRAVFVRGGVVIFVRVRDNDRWLLITVGW
jgi:hypothetical protein